MTIVHHEASPKYEAYARRLHELRRREGVTYEDAVKLVRSS